jgi:hypothetical protein
MHSSDIRSNIMDRRVEVGCLRRLLLLQRRRLDGIVDDDLARNEVRPSGVGCSERALLVLMEQMVRARESRRSERSAVMVAEDR